MCRTEEKAIYDFGKKAASAFRQDCKKAGVPLERGSAKRIAKGFEEILTDSVDWKASQSAHPDYVSSVGCDYCLR